MRPALRLDPLDPDRDLAAVAALYAEAADYVRLETGAPPGPGTAAAFFADAPPGRTPADCDRLGLREGADPLIGLADLARDYPEPATWYLGLLLLAPRARGRGLGRLAAAALAARARAGGARRLRLAALAANPRGLAFWRREGFVDRREVGPRRIGACDHLLIELERALD